MTSHAYGFTDGWRTTTSDMQCMILGEPELALCFAGNSVAYPGGAEGALAPPLALTKYSVACS